MPLSIPSCPGDGAGAAARLLVALVAVGRRAQLDGHGEPSEVGAPLALHDHFRVGPALVVGGEVQSERIALGAAQGRLGGVLDAEGLEQAPGRLEPEAAKGEPQAPFLELLQAGDQSPAITTASGVNATDVMITASSLLKAADLQVFELGMWQSWTGR